MTNHQTLPIDGQSIAPLDILRKDNKFQALFAGDTSGYSNQSEADLALCRKLAFYTHGDFLNIDKFFRISGLFRPEWDEKQGTRTYGDTIIIKALQLQRKYYKPNKPKKPAKENTVIIDDNRIFHLTDTGNAERLAQRYGHDVRYCTLWKKWLVWDGHRWKKDDVNQILKLSKDVVRYIYQEAAQITNDNTRREIVKHALYSEASNKRIDMLKMAQAEDNIPILPNQLDTDPWLLNVQNGTLDLRTGELYDHKREDYQTYYLDIPYDTKARCPTWIKFLNRVTNNDTTLMDYLQKVVGYCLTGDTTEQCLFFLYGYGHNGKTTFVETLQSLLSEYALSTPINTLLTKNYQGVPNDIASLKGARLVTTSEVPEGKRLNEPLVKDLTGGDTISARFMHSEFFNFKPQFKLLMFGNHKPVIHGTDEGIWRRMRLIPFTVTIPPKERDSRLGQKLLKELPGILAWAVEGCRAWQRYGLGIPEIVRKATASYRDEMDAVGVFISECCVIDRRAKATARDLYSHYLRWCEENGERPITQTRFGMSLTERGFDRRKNHGTFEWEGIRLSTFKD